MDLSNPRTGGEIGHHTLVASAPVASISFSPHGTFLATSGGEWRNVTFTPDGRYLVVYTDGTVYRWPVSLSALGSRYARSGRNFTHEEWSRFVGSRSYSAVCPQFPVPSG